LLQPILHFVSASRLQRLFDRGFTLNIDQFRGRFPSLCHPRTVRVAENYHTYLELLSEQCDVGLRLFLVLFLATGWVAA
jgi:hypothetical protein